MALTTPLIGLHHRLGAKFTLFAGYEMPVQFPAGILAEERHTRSAAALFDVSHMGQVRLLGGDAAERLERLVPGDIRGLAEGRARYTLFTTESGGILDDVTVARSAAGLTMVVNAARRAVDLDHLKATFGGDAVLLADRALLALQGPAAAPVMERLAPGIAALAFMQATECRVGDTPATVMRTGYTGEDGFEISLPGERAERMAERLLDQREVMPAGLGARDGLRLEAGLCLYGHDIDETTSPVEAGLGWTIPKHRRNGSGYPGAAVIARQFAEGIARRRVGIRARDRAIAREGSDILDDAGNRIGQVTSGGFSPVLEGPIAMGYVESRAAAPGTMVALRVRGADHAAEIVPLPFVPHRYHRGPNHTAARGTA